MESLLIRESEPRDDAVLGQLLVDAFNTAYGRKLPHLPPMTAERERDLRDIALKRAEGLVLVGELEGRPVATVSVFPPGAQHNQSWLPHAADIRHLAVDPAYFGRGLAHLLLDEMERRVRDWDVRHLSLHVRQGANGVARLYLARGYLRAPEGDLSRPQLTLEAYRKPSRT